jgi:hypothetical protein
VFTHDQLSHFVEQFEGSRTKPKVVEKTTQETKSTPIRSDRPGFRPIGATPAATEENQTSKKIESHVQSASSTSLSAANKQEDTVQQTNTSQSDAEEMDDNIDGVPMSTQSMTVVTGDTAAQQDNHHLNKATDADQEDDEDIDGAPLDTSHYASSLSETYRTKQNEEMEEDEEDIDGEAMYDNETTATNVRSIEAEIIEKLERYQASLAAMPHLKPEEVMQRVEAFHEALLKSYQVTLEANQPSASDAQPTPAAPSTTTQAPPNLPLTDDFDMFAD